VPVLSCEDLFVVPSFGDVWLLRSLGAACVPDERPDSVADGELLSVLLWPVVDRDGDCICPLCGELLSPLCGALMLLPLC
jgi:hypothetical protein